MSQPVRCAVIGGGFIGLEFTAVARSLGHTVTVAEAAPRLMPRVISAQMSARFLTLHENMGSTFHLGNPVNEITRNGIVLSDGARVDADVILRAAGVLPNTDLAVDAGLKTDNGIVVDDRLLTDDEAISALGDCATFPDPATGRLVRLESVQAATDHARLIAKRLLKNSLDAYDAVPWFWSDQSDYKLQIAGLAYTDDDALVREDGAVFRFAGERLSAVETINDAKTHIQARKRLAAMGPNAYPGGEHGLTTTRDQLIAANLDIAAL